MAHIAQRLLKSDERKKLLSHRLFEQIKRGDCSRETAAKLVGQWLYPLQYFPTYLARVILCLSPNEAAVSYVGSILYQKTGEGNPEASHAKLFIRSITEAGFQEHLVTNSSVFVQTKQLVDCYRDCSAKTAQFSRSYAIGSLYATETVYLDIVSVIGDAIGMVADCNNLPWTGVHIKQIPNRVENASLLLTNVEEIHEKYVIQAAEDIWLHWHMFFSRIATRINIPELGDG